MSSRGVNRSLYSAIFDDPDFQALPASARHVLLTARLCQQAGPGAIFTCYPEVLARQTGLTARQVEGALKALERDGWIQREGLVLWVVNGLRYDPTMHLSDTKHQKAVARSVAALPRFSIVLKFCDYYQIIRPFDGPSQGETTSALPKTEDRRPSTEDRRPNNPSPPAGPEEPAWGRPSDLIALYNRLAPPELGRVEKVSEARKRKAAASLRQFPEREFWTRTFSELRFSAFLRGLKPSPGHEHFRGDLDWILTKGKDGTENAVKVAEGKFRDKERAG